MKNKILFLLFLIFEVSSVFSQTNNNTDPTRINTYVIEYDFQTGLYKTNNLQLKVNTPVVFKIINVNRLAYDVKISSKDSILSETFLTDPPISFPSNEKGTGTGNQVVKLESDVSSVGSKNLGISNIDKNSDIIKKEGQKEEINKVYDDILKLPLIQKLQDQLLKKEKSYSDLNLEQKKIVSNKEDSLIYDKFDQAKKDADAARDKVLSELIKVKGDSITIIKGQIKDLSEGLNEVVQKFNKDYLVFQDWFNKYYYSYEAILKLVDSYNEIKSVADNPFMSTDYYREKCKDNIHKKVDLILQQKDNVLQFKNYYNQVNINYGYLKYNPYLMQYFNYGGQIKLYSQADFLKEMADKMNTEISKLDVDFLFQKIEHMICFLEKSENYEIVSAPIQPFNDVAIFDVSITKKPGNNSQLGNDKKFKHREFTYGGTRIDFSLGLAASYFPNTDVYELASVERTVGLPNTRYSTIAVKNDELIVPSMLGLVTMSYRRTSYIAYGASAGLGIDVVNGKVQLSNFFAGPTVLFGKYDRIFLTTGCSFRNVGQLKSGYVVGQELPNGTNDIENYVTDRYKIGFFIGVSYNLTKGARDDYKKVKQF